MTAFVAMVLVGRINKQFLPAGWIRKDRRPVYQVQGADASEIADSERHLQSGRAILFQRSTHDVFANTEVEGEGMNAAFGEMIHTSGNRFY
jgi:hypothetical protein